MENLWEKISYVYNNYNAQLRDDLGGVQYTPSILILFYDDDGIARAKFEGTEEIRKGMATGLLKEVIREFIRRRNRLKASERMAEALAIHVAGMMISAEQRRRSPSSFEERMRMLEKEKESEKQKKRDELKQHEDEIEELRRKLREKEAAAQRARKDLNEI